jgi:hypothetical protein
MTAVCYSAGARGSRTRVSYSKIPLSLGAMIRFLSLTLSYVNAGARIMLPRGHGSFPKQLRVMEHTSARQHCESRYRATRRTAPARRHLLANARVPQSIAWRRPHADQQRHIVVQSKSFATACIKAGGRRCGPTSALDGLAAAVRLAATLGYATASPSAKTTSPARQAVPRRSTTRLGGSARSLRRPCLSVRRAYG